MTSELRSGKLEPATLLTPGAWGSSAYAAGKLNATHNASAPVQTRFISCSASLENSSRRAYHLPKPTRSLL
jgi:hypothetical protein